MDIDEQTVVKEWQIIQCAYSMQNYKRPFYIHSDNSYIEAPFYKRFIPVQEDTTLIKRLFLETATSCFFKLCNPHNNRAFWYMRKRDIC